NKGKGQCWLHHRRNKYITKQKVKGCITGEVGYNISLSLY
ncbi:MAG: hypothetical protein ACI90V_013063, partial [Bacillariaceae sp.]